MMVDPVDDARKGIYCVFDYDSSRYDFSGLVAEVFGTARLERLHLLRSDLLPQGPLSFEDESRTAFHRLFYGRLRAGWERFVTTYEGFVRDVVSPHVGDRDFAYQYLPSFRIHLPGDKAIHKWHHDSDTDHGHPEGEINFQLALTECFGNNALWIESAAGRGDFRPMELRPGQCVRFDGNKLCHGNQVNDTGVCRLSLDFRVLPMRRYDPQGCGRSATARKQFRIGDYYKRV